MSNMNDHSTWSHTTSDLHVSLTGDDNLILWKQSLKPQVVADAELEAARVSKGASRLAMVSSIIAILGILGFSGPSDPEMNCGTNKTGNQVTNIITNDITDNIVQNYGIQETTEGHRRGK